MIRMKVDGIRFTGRSAQGVTLFKVAENEHIVSVALLKAEDDEPDETVVDGVDAETGEGGALTTDTPDETPTEE
jgi:DNA gyrase subunit A